MVRLVLYCFVVGLPGLARASSGPAHSDLTASADSAMTAAANPAGLVRLKQPEWVVQALAFGSDSTFVTTEDSFSGVTEDDSDGSLFIPFLYYARPINEQLSFGFSITAPGGLGSDPNDNGPQRYVLDEWSLGYISIAPALGYRLNDRLSIGGGIGINYSVLQYESAVFNLDPDSADGRMELEASDVSLGFQLGLLWELSPRTRIGAAWRSENSTDLEAVPDFFNLAPGRRMMLEQAGLLDQEIALQNSFPQTLNAGIHHELTGGSTVAVDLLWSDFSEYGFSGLSLGNNEITTEPEIYQDIWAISVGFSRPLRDTWTLKFGGMYLSEPVDDENRTFALRIGNIWGVGIGAERRLAGERVVGINLNYYDLGDAPATVSIPLLGQISGAYTTHEAIGLDFTFRWLR